ncbi:TIGR03617 family F420-dependent LLM class oxidoreductase [Mycolicibacterium sphagni]|nr:TIGR03617 family F420-dependent LLM class oxidoreductase [Mycolicibacterium sphagni]
MRVYAGMDPALPLREVATYTRRVEALGFDGIRIPESIHDALMVATLVVEHSVKLQVGTGVMLAFPRSPMVVALAAWDLQALSGGRFVLGLGSQVRGNMIGRFSGSWAPPVPRMRDYIASLRAIWAAFQSGSPLTHRSEHYTFTRLQPLFNPGPIEFPHIPIALGAVNPGMCRLAGGSVEELITHPTNSSRDYLQKVVLPSLREGSADAVAASVSLTAMVPLITASSLQQLDLERGRQRRLFAQLFSTPNYGFTLKALGWQEVGERLHQLSKRGCWAEMEALITDEMLDAIAPAALHDEIADALLHRYVNTADALLLMPPDTPIHDDALRAVIAALRAG